jgi:hypothetical protein
MKRALTSFKSAGKKNQRRITKIGNENGNTNTKKFKENRTKSAGKENETCCIGTSATLIFLK